MVPNARHRASGTFRLLAAHHVQVLSLPADSTDLKIVESPIRKNQEITDIRGYREKQSDSVIAEICIGSMAQELASAITTRYRFYHVDCRQLKNICSLLICRVAA